jgi:hypothetical protein
MFLFFGFMFGVGRLSDCRSVGGLLSAAFCCFLALAPTRRRGTEGCNDRQCRVEWVGLRPRSAERVGRRSPE